MNNLLIAGTIALITTLFVGGVWHPDSLLMVFASTEAIQGILRLGLMLLLGTLLFVRPPRSLRFRIVLVVASAILFAMFLWTLFGSGGYMLDAFVALEVAFIFLLEALEPVKKKLTVVSTPAR